MLTAVLVAPGKRGHTSQRQPTGTRHLLSMRGPLAAAREVRIAAVVGAALTAWRCGVTLAGIAMASRMAMVGAGGDPHAASTFKAGLTAWRCADGRDQHGVQDGHGWRGRQSPSGIHCQSRLDSVAVW